MKLQLKKERRAALKKKTNKLTFAMSDESETEEEQLAKKVKKNPQIDTSFLPDPDREVREKQLKAQLTQEFHEIQERRKNQLLEICFNYWDGTNKINASSIQMSRTVGAFLRKIKEELYKEYPELRTISDDGLMFVVFDTIIPSHLTFYDIITNKVTDKERPLFIVDESIEASK